MRLRILVLLISCAIVLPSWAVETRPFPLGKLPAGWTYKEVSSLARQFEAFPFEVTGVLQRGLGPNKKVSIFVVMKPIERSRVRSPASLWQWVDQTFVRQGLTVPRTYELDVQKNVGPGNQWTYREAKISQAGVPTSLASFYAKSNYHHVFLVLREEQRDYQIHLSQLKDLVSDMRLR